MTQNEAIRGIEALKVFKESTLFRKEKDLADYIENNIETFCKDELGGELKYYKREQNVEICLPRITGVGRRIDFAVTLKNNEHIGIECKGLGGDTQRAIIQLLGYAVSMKFDRLVIVSGNFDYLVQEIIEQFNLPIELIYLSEEYSLSYKG